MPFAAGARLGPYEILGLLGAGGRGEVYRARDTRLGHEVAIKVLPAERLADEGWRSRFVREARAASAVNHPNIVTIYEIESAEGVDFIVMELVTGKTLDALIPRQGMRVGEALRVAIPLADALAAAHAAGIIPRDLKPANVMVTPEGVVKVLAKLTQGKEASGEDATKLDARARLSHPGTVAGTPAYMSPEQAAGGAVDARSDVFSFGAVLYEMVTGRRPFGGGSSAETLAALLKKQPKSPSDIAPDVPKELERVILRCLRKEPARRFQNMLDLKVELEELKQESDSQRFRPAPPRATVDVVVLVWRYATPGGLVLLLVLVASAALLIGAAWCAERRRGQSTSPAAVSPDAREAGWYLETVAEDGSFHREPIHALPFRIGRRQGLGLVLPADSVSKNHAEIYARGSGLRLRDLGSRNGTFLNRAPVEDAALVEGDVLHFATYEFRLGRSNVAEPTPAVAPDRRPATVAVRRPGLPHQFEHPRADELRELLRGGQVTIEFQPIVLLSRGTVAAYEALGRGLHPHLDENRSELLRIAESIGAEVELSRLFRKKAVELAAQRPEMPTIFLNTHPKEFAQPGLLESLEELREIAPHLDLALEIHERVLTRPAAITELRQLLIERHIALAYDNFGAREDQRRLLELSDALPHYLKFARRFIHDLDQASVDKRRLLHSLLALARKLLVNTVAQGIETPAEARACAELGFTHGQGFHFGPPRALEQI